MGTEDQDSDSGANLQRTIREHGKRRAGVVDGATTLPHDVFDACDPMVEQALAQAAMKVFRRHMMGDEHVMPEVLPQGEVREEHVPVEEIRACVAEFTELATVASPTLASDLTPERMWILLDMSRNSAGLARQRATAELRELLGNPNLAAQIGTQVLAALVHLLEEARTKPGVPIVFQALHLTAERALRSATEKPA